MKMGLRDGIMPNRQAISVCIFLRTEEKVCQVTDGAVCMAKTPGWMGIKHQQEQSVMPGVRAGQ